MPIVSRRIFLNERTFGKNCADDRAAVIAEILEERCGQIPTSIYLTLRNRGLMAIRRGLLIAQVLLSKLKASFNFA